MTEQPLYNNDVTQDDRLWAALGYPVALIALIALLVEDKKNRPFIRYHAVQSLALNVVLIILMFLFSVTIIGALCAPFFWLVTLWPAYEAYNGKYLELPVLTDFLRNQGWLS